MKFVVEVQENKTTGELYIEFPDDVIKELGWKEGDTVKWNDNKDGTYTLEKI